MAPPTAGALKSLESLYLDYNQITNAGCAALASALRGGALPALRMLGLRGNPTSEEAKEAVLASRSGLAEESDDEFDDDAEEGEEGDEDE